MGVGLATSSKLDRTLYGKEENVFSPAKVIPIDPIAVWAQTLCEEKLTP